jgi:hypothetical protein
VGETGAPLLLKTLLVDLETAPFLVYCWTLREADAIHVERPWFILSAAWQWFGDKKIHCKGLIDFQLYKREPHNDRELTKELWDLFDRADVVIAHNAPFDIKKSNARFMAHELGIPAPCKILDTCKLARKCSDFGSNRLDHLARSLDIGQKLEHSGKHTWLGALQGDRKAWRVLKKYNAMDVLLLEQLYRKLRAWDQSHPNAALLSGKKDCCPVCTSASIQRRGTMVTAKLIKQRWRCNDCGHWWCGATEKPSTAKAA